MEKTTSAEVGEKKSSWRLSQIRDKVLQELEIELKDVIDFESFAKLLHSPRDPSSLAVTRILYGLLMIIDVHQERGLSTADNRWGNPAECRFPLFNSLVPLPLEWMIIVYLLMLAGAIGITLGYHYRLSCLAFLIPYWYIFLLDKSHWNNHSYLFGLIGIQLMISGANRCWSLDGKRTSKLRYAHVPLWNYALLRGQIFLVYFIAGLKKTNLDWIGGYSMEKLGYHWVFDGFRIFLTGDEITYFVVHLGGFLLDLTVGFFMLMKFSRPYAFLFCALFNLMNSRMFAIGMFPYVMIAVMPIFCSSDWPKKITSSIETVSEGILKDSSPDYSTDCIYPLKTAESESPKQNSKENRKGILKNNVSIHHKMAALIFCLYFMLQAFMPYSHWLTKGYNTWTQGLYGYSWDMMVHNWRHVHTTVTVLDKNSQQLYYLDPQVWTRNDRWTHHADMVKQFAHCIQDRMSTDHGLSDIEVHIDVWLSLNRRFVQRMYDPTVDILSSKWSPFAEVTWVLPLQTELTNWRSHLVELEERHPLENVLFVTDFPGFHLLNYVNEKFGNVTLEVMKGIIEVHVETNKPMELGEGQSIEILSGAFHSVSPLKYRPACYKYTYSINSTMQENDDGFLQGMTCPANGCPDKYPKVEIAQCRGICWQAFKQDIGKKFQMWTKSMNLIGRALYSILSQNPMSVQERNISRSQDIQCSM